MTTCPKCGADLAATAVECERCGVVLAKFERRAVAPGTSTEANRTADRTPGDPADEALSGIVWWGRAALLALLVWFTWRFARAPLGTAVMESFLHLPNLVFHEAGHVLFSPFGRFLTVLGGSLLQLLVPAILAIAFVRERQLFGAAVCTWWVGQSMLDLAPYIADARALRLVLLGGRTGAEVEGHDWEYILTAVGLVHRDRLIGLWSHYLGVLVMVVSIGWAGAILVQTRSGGAGETSA